MAIVRSIGGVVAGAVAIFVLVGILDLVGGGARIPAWYLPALPVVGGLGAIAGGAIKARGVRSSVP